MIHLFIYSLNIDYFCEPYIKNIKKSWNIKPWTSHFKYEKESTDFTYKIHM